MDMISLHASREDNLLGEVCVWLLKSGVKMMSLHSYLTLALAPRARSPSPSLSPRKGQTVKVVQREARKCLG